MSFAGSSLLIIVYRLVKQLTMKQKSNKLIFFTLDASFSGNMVTGKDVILVGEGTLRPGKMMPPAHLTNFEVQKTLSKLKSIIWGLFKKTVYCKKQKIGYM